MSPPTVDRIPTTNPNGERSKMLPRPRCLWLNKIRGQMFGITLTLGSKCGLYRSNAYYKCPALGLFCLSLWCSLWLVCHVMLCCYFGCCYADRLFFFLQLKVNRKGFNIPLLIITPQDNCPSWTCKTPLVVFLHFQFALWYLNLDSNNMSMGKHRLYTL